MPSNRVIAIDPGFDRVGVAVIEKNELLFSTCIETDRKLPHHERLLTIGEEIKSVIKKWHPGTLAMEKLFFNQNTSTALKVAEARGVILFIAAEAGLDVFEYSPQEVKIAVTGYGKADKWAIETLVRKLIKFPSKKVLDDEIDAVAVGITHLATQKSI